MQHRYEDLAPSYAALWSSMVITRPLAAKDTAKRLVGHLRTYDAVSAATGVPSALIATLHERESGADFTTYLGNGDPLGHVTTHDPKGRGPFQDWASGAIDALKLDGLDKVPDWPMTRVLYEAELYNGFGPRDRGINTGYLWAGSNHYARGKYIRDGVWGANAIDQQLGVAVILKALSALSALAGIGGAVVPLPTARAPLAAGDVLALQRALNRLAITPVPLKEDGDFGPKTEGAVMNFQALHEMEPNGIADPGTLGAISAALAEVP